MANYITTDTELQSVANAIRTKGGTSNQLEYPTGFVSAIENIPTGGGVDPNWTKWSGNLDGFNIHGYFSKFLYDNRANVRLSNVSSFKGAFAGIRSTDEVKHFGFLDERVSAVESGIIDLTSIGYDSNFLAGNMGSAIERFPAIMIFPTWTTIIQVGSHSFRECQKLESLEGVLKNNKVTTHGSSITHLCYNCYSLREWGKNWFIPYNRRTEFNTIPNGNTYNNWFGNCMVLDSLENIPILNPENNTGANAFTNFLVGAYRINKITFETNNGTPYNVPITRNLTWDLTSYIGYCQNNVNLEDYGIPTGKQVTDQASYDLLKNDPDWWTKIEAYSRFNHDSAVALINSLPNNTDSTYKVTIRLRGNSGSATDGGAINTLTSSELAVATNKNWAITIV